MTKRTAIENFREELRQRNADSTFSNQFLYNELLKQARWLIRREVSGGRIYTNNSFFQTLSCIEVIETSPIDSCCPIKTNCKVFRTKNKLPDMWIDTNGPVLKSVSSVDGSTDFFYTNPTTWAAKANDPYQKMGNTQYSFFADGYLWFPLQNPHRVSVYGFFTEDISNVTDSCDDCEDKPCTRFLDTKFMLPDWLEAEMFAKALQQFAGITERLPEDEQIDKNTNRKN